MSTKLWMGATPSDGPVTRDRRRHEPAIASRCPGPIYWGNLDFGFIHENKKKKKKRPADQGIAPGYPPMLPVRNLGDAGPIFIVFHREEGKPHESNSTCEASRETFWKTWSREVATCRGSVQPHLRRETKTQHSYTVYKALLAPFVQFELHVSSHIHRLHLDDQGSNAYDCG